MPEETTREREAARPSGDEPEAGEETSEREGPSGVDAMGKEKRRQVVGASYRPSVAKQVTLWLAFFAVVVALFIGASIVAGKLDQPPESNPDVAPWSGEDVPQRPPRPIQ